MTSSTPPRARNRRGEGRRLRADILAAAAGILERTGREDRVTLRAIAREVGIAAPSIYAHFADRDEILAALISDAFADLAAALTTAAIEDLPDPVDRLRAGSTAYLEFADNHPQQYRVLFEHRRPARLEAGVSADQRIGAEAFSILVGRIAACVAAGRSRSVDSSADAAAVWVALHGYTTLRTSLPGFPWPGREELLDRIVLTLARIDP